MANFCLNFLSALLAGVLIMYTTLASVGVLVGTTWFTGPQNIGIACDPNEFNTNGFCNSGDSWSSLNTTAQEATAGLFLVAIGLGCISFVFLVLALLTSCCRCGVAGIIAGFFAFLQFVSILAAVCTFASMWSWSVPSGFSMGASYICAIIAIPLALIAAILALNHHRSHRDDFKA